MKVELIVEGRKFSQEELIDIIQKHLDEKKKSTATAIPKPMVDIWFDVKPKKINRKRFEEERTDPEEEKVRKRILWAFSMMDEYPEKYGKDFKTLIPNKTWKYKNYSDLEKLACSYGDHSADMVEHAFEWAQRIDNGETWRAVCIEIDTIEWYRTVREEHGKLIGGNTEKYDTKKNEHRSATHISMNFSECNGRLDAAVPLIVRYEKYYQ